MNFALAYAQENRRGMMDAAFQSLNEVCEGLGIPCEELWRYDIHHNYAALENHFGENVYVHRKGATSAKKGETGIIPGSMGTHSYIVEGLGNPESFMSCSHGAGRKMSRTAASERLTKEECDKAMEGIVCDRWSTMRRGKSAGKLDLSEAPGAYKDIEEVIANESDLVKPFVRLTPLAVLKG
jgi:tRNA-splicing ligase RtcB